MPKAPSAFDLAADILSGAPAPARSAIESEHGLIPFRPYPHQRSIMRQIAAGRFPLDPINPGGATADGMIIAKAGRTGISTAIIMALSHQLLYPNPTLGAMHGHIIAQKEEVAIGSLLKMAKVALSTVEKNDAQRRALKGTDPTVGSDGIYYTTRQSHSFLRAHPASESSSHSLAGNAIFMDEVAFMDNPGDIYSAGLRLFSANQGLIYLASTYKNDGDWFCDTVDSAEAMGLLLLEIDWRVRPDHDDAWREAQNSKYPPGEEWRAAQEHDLQRHNYGSPRLDPALVKKLAAQVRWEGGTPQIGHSYSKGVDLSGSGQDLSVIVVVDTAVRPCQVVFTKSWHWLSTPAKIQNISDMDQLWPGPMYLDGTKDQAICALIPAERKTAIHFTAGSTTTEKRDRGDGLVWKHIPRSHLESALAANLETGKLVAHLEHFSELKQGLFSWQDQPDASKKRRAKCVDFLDALMLANIPLAGGRQGTPSQMGVTTIPSDRRLGSFRRRF